MSEQANPNGTSRKFALSVSQGGSLAAAALQLGWKFTGIDIERKYIETTECRIEGMLR